ncbi:MAG TPA: MFS transporter [Ktedonobacterales bacterium]|nr:MFS transporter [Ktedonobacterales bacterium]
MARQTDEGIGEMGNRETRLSSYQTDNHQPEGEAPPENPSGASTAWAYTQSYARYIFWLMFCINMMNYVDRWVFSLLLPLIQTDRAFCHHGIRAHFCINDFQTGLLSSSFILIYAIGALPLGFLADRVKRKDVIAAGVAIWSAATLLTAFVHGFFGLLMTRTWLGFGEASYTPAGTSLLSSYFPGKQRAQIMSRWSAGALVGFAVGIIAGGLVAQLTQNWRLAFLFIGPPGLLLAFLMWKAREPARHAIDESDGMDGQHSYQLEGNIRSALARIRSLLRIRTLTLCIIIQALGASVITPSAIFFSPLLKRDYHLPLIGIGGAALLLALASIGGALGGGYLADWLTKRYAGGRLMAGGISFLLAAPVFALALLSPNFWVFLPFFILSGALLNAYLGPLNAVLQDVLPPAMRASGVALTFMLMHLLGDLAAPSIIGGISYLLDPQNGSKLAEALLITGPAALVIAGVIGIWGSRFVAQDTRRASGRIIIQSA